MCSIFQTVTNFTLIFNSFDWLLVIQNVKEKTPPCYIAWHHIASAITLTVSAWKSKRASVLTQHIPLTFNITLMQCYYVWATWKALESTLLEHNVQMRGLGRLKGLKCRCITTLVMDCTATGLTTTNANNLNHHSGLFSKLTAKVIMNYLWVQNWSTNCWMASSLCDFRRNSQGSKLGTYQKFPPQHFTIHCKCVRNHETYIVHCNVEHSAHCHETEHLTLST